jgi:hypothetical protein
MDRNDIVEYLKMVHTYYPSSIGITKDKLFLLTENITSDEWSAYKEACQTKKNDKDKWAEFISVLRDQIPEAIIENRTVDGNFTSPSCSAHLTFQFDNDHRKIILHKTVFDNLICVRKI